MRALPPSVRHFGLLLVLLGAPGCSDPEPAPVTPVMPVTPIPSVTPERPLRDYDEIPDDGLPLSPRAAPFEVAADECVVTTSRRGRASAGAPVATIATYTRRDYDPTLRIFSEINLDNRGDVSGRVSSEHRQLDETGRVLVAIHQERQGPIGRIDYGRDAQHNLVSRRSAAVDAVDFESAPAPATPEYTNMYDGEGLLLRHVRADETFDYVHEADGRCASITTRYWIERREYDADGRLQAQLFDPTEVTLESTFKRESYRIDHRYDEHGREIASEQDGGGGVVGVASDGDPDVLLLHTYQEDGSVVVQYTDFLIDSTNDRVERHGQLRPARHSFEVFSPGCQALQARMPASSSQRCVTD
jgi:hypothetical protein